MRPGFIFASNHNTPLAIADKDRRLSFLTNGEVQSSEFYVKVNNWLAVPGNIGAFRRDLEAVDLTGFDAYAPLATTLQDIVTEDSRSAIDEAVDLALETLPGEIVLSAQVVETIEILRLRQGLYLRGEWQALAVRERKSACGGSQGRRQLAAVPAATRARSRLRALGGGTEAVDDRRPCASARRAAEKRSSNRKTPESDGAAAALHNHRQRNRGASTMTTSDRYYRKPYLPCRVSLPAVMELPPSPPQLPRGGGSGAVSPSSALFWVSGFGSEVSLARG